MKAYSKDLRERVMAAIDKGGRTKGEVAEEYEVSRSFIKKILKQRRELGHIEPLGHGGGQEAKLKKGQIEFIERNKIITAAYFFINKIFRKDTEEEILLVHIFLQVTLLS